MEPYSKTQGYKAVTTMPKLYSHPITQSHRSAIIFCIDCSTSMQERVTFNNRQYSKAEIATLFTNIMIDELYIRSSRYNRTRNYYDIAVIGYGEGGAFPMLDSKDISFMPITDLNRNMPEEQVYCFTHIINGKEHDVSFIVHPWIKPIAQGKTPMYEALTEAYRLVEKWCSKRCNRASFPPMVFNITDGESTDSRPIELLSIANNIKNTGTRDGNTLMINAHIGCLDEEKPLLFPRAFDNFNYSLYSHLLYNMSSIVPPNIEPLLPPEERFIESTLERRLMTLNASPYDLLNIIHIGSESIQNL